MDLRNRIILDLCGGTGAWSRPYKKAGYDVRIITLPEDIRLSCPPDNVYGILSAPPCTDLCSSGARWWAGKGPEGLYKALSIVDASFRFVAICQPMFWALENPVGRLIHYLGKPKLYFDPCDFGDPWTKRTCLWGNFNMPTKNPVKPESKNRIWYARRTSFRGRTRSITPSGFAQAFFEANQ